jgi:hypothetical protein
MNLNVSGPSNLRCSTSLIRLAKPGGKRARREIVGNQALAYEQDLDPAEDAVETEDGRSLSAEKLISSFVSGRDVPDA